MASCSLDVIDEFFRSMGVSTSTIAAKLLVVGAVVALVVVAVCVIVQRRTGKLRDRRNLAIWALLGAFAVGVLFALGIQPNFPPNGDRWGTSRVQLAPFADFVSGSSMHWDRTAALQYAANIVLFIPVGITATGVAVSLQKRQVAIVAATSGFAVSLLIEVAQYVLPTWRVSSIDDLPANTLGAFAGYVLYRVVTTLARMMGRSMVGTRPVVRSGGQE